jgi:hypothetical protein
MGDVCSNPLQPLKSGRFRHADTLLGSAHLAGAPATVLRIHVSVCLNSPDLARGLELERTRVMPAHVCDVY